MVCGLVHWQGKGVLEVVRGLDGLQTGEEMAKMRCTGSWTGFRDPSRLDAMWRGSNWS